MERKKSNGENDLDGDVETIDLVSDDSEEEEGPALINYVIEPFSADIFKKCVQCSLSHKPKYSVTDKSITSYICNDKCLMAFETEKKIVSGIQPNIRVKNLETVDNDAVAKIKFERKCGECTKDVSKLKTILSWETMEFCNEHCLEKYQMRKLSKCTYCGNAVIFAHLGKYSERFGHDIRQFCSKVCLQKFKDTLKMCSSCHKNISGSNDICTTSFGEGKQINMFCNRTCLLEYEVAYHKRLNPKPSCVCLACEKKINTSVELKHDGITKSFCDHSCFAAFEFNNDILTDKCGVCEKYVDINTLKKYSMYLEDTHHAFCSEKCKNIYLTAVREPVSCNQCRERKNTVDMIQWKMHDVGQLTVCSLYCFKVYYSTQNIRIDPEMQCSYCQKRLQPGYYIVGGIKNHRIVAVFCALPCYTAFQKQSEIKVPPPDVPCTSKQTSREPQKTPNRQVVSTETTVLEASTFATTKSTVSSRPTIRARTKMDVQNMVVKKYQQKIMEPKNTVPLQRSIGTMCEVIGQDKSVFAKPATVTKGIQTDEEKSVILPILLPVHVSLPILRGSLPFPLQFTFPEPVPVPIATPTTCETLPENMMKIQDIRQKLPADPLQAGLIMLANMAADRAQIIDPFETETDKDSEVERDDVPQEEGGISEIPLNTIQGWEEAISPSITDVARADEEESSRTTNADQQRASSSTKRSGDFQICTNKKQRLQCVNEIEASPSSFQAPECDPAEQIEAEMALNYTLGLRAWNNWVLTRSATTENSSATTLSLNTEILHHTVDELSCGLCLFVKEIRKPNGQPYPPDTIYYFCLCIQTYLLKNDRADNIFFDSSYKKFTERLEELVQPFLVLWDAVILILHIREEYLWESHQLGDCSPYELLNTMMYFNTKLFNLKTSDGHRQLSFLDVMKLWQKFKKSGTSKRFTITSPLSQEQEFIRNPTNLYKFYLTKCPEHLKKQDGAFYLLPKRYWSPDSPVWFSSRTLPQYDLKKMFNRIKFVKEIQLAFLCN